MMYSNKLAIALKSNGKVLREYGDTVYVPFGSEFSILIKNLSTLRVAVSITIDGTDVMDGARLIVDANDEKDLTRYIKNGNLSQGNRFKFIERSAGIEAHRGIKIDDGIIRVEYEFERPPVIRRDPDWNYRSVSSELIGSSYSSSYRGSDSFMTKGLTKGISSNSASFCSASLDSSTTRCSVNDAGITVPGSVSNQQFSTVYNFNGDGSKRVMVLKLLGETEDNKPVQTPVYVTTKPKCVTCGTTNRATNKFCSQCGTSLQIV